ncbi:MAG: TetR/AcrR family transcriptional regulator [Microbacterium sp.]
MARQGKYSKGIAKRAEILRRGHEVIARTGPGAAYIKDIADAVGLTPAGLLHYFGSREELFAAILRERDRHDVAEFWPKAAEANDIDALRRGYLGIVRHNTEMPGLVQLYMNMASEAHDPEHPGHGFLRDHGEELRGNLIGGILALQSSGTLDADIDPVVLARVLQAVADGLQLQWLIEPDVDMVGGVDVLFRLLLPGLAVGAGAAPGEGSAGGSISG